MSATPSGSRARPEATLLRRQMRRPVDSRRLREPEVRAQCVAHRIGEPLRPAWRKAVLPPDVENLHARVVAVDSRLETPDQSVAEDDGQDVPAPPPLFGRHEELPHVVEAEQVAEQPAVPDHRIERREECDRGGRLRWILEQADLVTEDEPLAAHALDVDRDHVSALDELLAERVPA